MRFWRITLSLLAVLALFARGASAAERRDPTLPGDLDARIEKGLAYLGRQQKADGSFESERATNALTGLSILAFLARGYTPDVGRYGLTVRGALDYLLKLAPDKGYYGRDGGMMYGHAIVTLALAEAYGTETDPVQRKRMRAQLDAAVGVILEAQKVVRKEPANQGGWRYEPSIDDSDLSVTSWCVVALRAASDAGLEVPRESARASRQYVLNCFQPDKNAFAYMPRKDPSASMSGAAVLCLNLLDAGNSPEAGAGVKYVVDHPVNDQTPYFYYSLYYTTQAAYQAGDTVWPAIWRNAYEQLAKRQMPEGCWRPTADEAGKVSEQNGKERVQSVYATSMAVLTLAVPYRLLPIYQR